MKNLFKFILFSVFVATALVSCSNDDQSGTAEISFILVDAPGPYEKVLVNVQAIEVIVDGEAHQFSVNEPGQIELIELSGGNFADLLSENIPAGRLSQIRLILGETENEVVMKETMEVVGLQTPSAQQTGLKLNVNYDLQPGVTYEFILDFNVGESVVELGAGQGLILKPVIRVTTKAQSGAIAGMVSPAAEATVTATNGGTPITAYTNSETGEFLLFGVPEGTYTVLIEPSVGATVTVEDVVVQTGVTTQMVTVNL